MWFGIWIRSTGVTDLGWPCGVERWCAQPTRTMCGPKKHQIFAFVSITSCIFAIKHGFVRKSAWGCSSYDLIAPWPDLTRSNFFLPKSAQRMSHWLCQISSWSSERFRHYCEKKLGGRCYNTTHTTPLPVRGLMHRDAPIQCLNPNFAAFNGRF